MGTAAYLPFPADRYTPCVRTIRVVGVDLTAVALRMQVRLRPETPGAPLIDLATVTVAGTQGLRLTGVEVVDTIPTSIVELRINKESFATLPYSGEVGAVTPLAYDLIFGWGTTAAKVRLKGAFLILPGVTGADAATLPSDGGWSAPAGPLSAWGEATLTFTDGAVTVVIDDLDRLVQMIADVRAYLQSEIDAAIAAFNVEKALLFAAFTADADAALAAFAAEKTARLADFGREADTALYVQRLEAETAMAEFRQETDEALDDFTVLGAGAVQGFNVAYPGALVRIEAALAATAAGPAAAGPRVDLTNPGFGGLLQLRVDGLDPAGSNAARLNANAAACAAAGKRARIPAGALIGLTASFVVPSFLDLDMEPGAELRKLYSGAPLVTTSGVAVGVRLSGLATRGLATFSGAFFGGSYSDGVFEDPVHLGSVEAGIAFSFGALTRMKFYRPKARGMPALPGAGGFRPGGGALDTYVYDGDIESGDDAWQIVPPARVLGLVYDNLHYVNCRGKSAISRGIIISTGPSTNTVIRNCTATGHFSGGGSETVGGGGRPVSVGGKGGLRYPVVGTITGEVARLAFPGVSRRGYPPIQQTEIAAVSSVGTPARTFTGQVANQGTAIIPARFVFSASEQSITAPDNAIAFAPLTVGDYIAVYDGAGLTGANDGFFAQITAKMSPSKIVVSAMPVNEDSSAYSISNAVTFTMAVPGQADGALPGDAIITRAAPNPIEGLKITGTIDGAGSLQATAISWNGLIYHSTLDVWVDNPRSQLIGIKEGGPLPSSNFIRIRTAQAPSNWEGSPLVDMQRTVGGEYVIEAVAAPGQDGFFIRSIGSDHDDEDTEVVYSTTLAQGPRLGGCISGLTSQKAAARIVDNVQRVTIAGLRAVAAPGVTDAQLAFFGAGASGVVGACDLIGIAAGNTLENAIKRQPGSAVRIMSDCQAIPGYSLTPGALITGVATAAQTIINMGGSVPPSFASRLDVAVNGATQTPGTDFTTNGTATLTFTGAGMSAGDTFRISHRD